MVKEKLVLYYYPSSRCTESQCVLLSCLCLSILNVIFKIEGPDPAVLLSGVISPVQWNISIDGLFRLQGLDAPILEGEALVAHYDSCVTQHQGEW